jgi:hypothetical protein
MMLRRNAMLKATPALLMILAAGAGAAESASDEPALVIGRNPKLIEMDAARATELCKILGGSDDKAKAQALAALQKDRLKAGPLLVACLDPKTTDVTTRLGAMKGIESLRLAGKEYSGALSLAAVRDPVPELRSAAVATIKTRGDDPAIQGMLGQLVSAFDPLGNVKDNGLHNNAVAALKDLGDRRVYQALLYYVTMELRLTNISEGNLTTRQIDTFSVNNGANNAIPMQLALPIQTPDLSVARVNTSVVSPASVAPALSALRSLSGEDFGTDWEKWTRWVDKKK